MTDKKECRKLPINLDAECTYEKDAKSGAFHMMLSRSDVKDNGKVIGTIGISLGGYPVVEIGGCTYHISLDEIWSSVHAAHEKFISDHDSDILG